MSVNTFQTLSRCWWRLGRYRQTLSCGRRDVCSTKSCGLESVCAGQPVYLGCRRVIVGSPSAWALSAQSFTSVLYFKDFLILPQSHLPALWDYKLLCYSDIWRYAQWNISHIFFNHHKKNWYQYSHPSLIYWEETSPFNNVQVITWLGTQSRVTECKLITIPGICLSKVFIIVYWELLKYHHTICLQAERWVYGFLPPNSSHVHVPLVIADHRDSWVAWMKYTEQKHQKCWAHTDGKNVNFCV